VDVGLTEQLALKSRNKRGNYMQTVVKLNNKNKVQPITADLDGWKVVAGMPSMKIWILHTSADGGMISGCWEAKPGT
jgi:uncharacterized cupin superfamily protein